MNILLKYSHNYVRSNFEDIVEDSEQVFFAVRSYQDAIRIINKFKIDKILLEMVELEEIKLIEYINRYFPKINIVVFTSHNNEYLLETIRSGIYNLAENPINYKKLLKEIS